jgi:hypothetical protein
LGILYRQERLSQSQRYRNILDKAKASDVETMLDSFNARKGAAIGKPS